MQCLCDQRRRRLAYGIHDFGRNVRTRQAFGQIWPSQVPARWVETKVAPRKCKRHDFHRLNEHININSLTETLENHRTANTVSRIRKIGTDPDAGVYRPNTWPDLPEDGQDVSKLFKAGPQLSSSPLTRQNWSDINRRADKLNMPDTTDVRLSRNAAPMKTRRATHVPENWKSFNGHVGIPEERIFIAARRHLLKEYAKVEDELLPTEEDLFDQIEILRRTRQTMHAEMVNLYKNPTTSLMISRGILEYRARIVHPHIPKYAEAAVEPWVDGRQWDQLLGLRRLEAEIWNFMDWMQPTDTESAAREKVRVQTLRLLERTLPDFSARVFGSSTTGLAMPTSDIDIRLYLPVSKAKKVQDTAAEFANKREKFVASLQTLSSTLEQEHPDYIQSEFVDGRHPILATRHKPSGLKLQIVASPDTYASRAYIKHCMRKYPTLKALFSLVKTALDVRGLSDVWNGGLGSYSIFIMVVTVLNLRSRTRLETTLAKTCPLSKGLISSKGLTEPTSIPAGESSHVAYKRLDSLQQSTKPEDGPETSPSTSQDSNAEAPTKHEASPEPTNGLFSTDTIDEAINSEDTVATQFMHFLRFWGTEYNPYKYGISAATATLFLKRPRARDDEVKSSRTDRVLAGQLNMAKPVLHTRYLLCLQDPADPYNDLGRKSFAFKHVQATFRQMYTMLYGTVEHDPRWHRKTPILRIVVGRCDIAYDDRRAMLELFGEGYISESEEIMGVGKDAEMEERKEALAERAFTKGAFGFR